MIAVENLRIEHHHRVLLDDVSFCLKPGEIVGLLGPNGAGKSTLVHTLVGLRRPKAGAVLVDGKPIDRQSARERARMLSYVAQKQNFLWDLTVAEIIELGAGSRSLADNTMARLGLGTFASRRIKSLSGGEQARVMMARALAVRAPFLLADEPAASLDIKQQRSMMRMLREEAHECGTSVLVVLHELNLAFAFADRILLMDRGHLIHDAPASEMAQSKRIDRVFGETFARLSVDGQTLLFPTGAGL